jgi:8-oxo-dGTP diphosphatase
VTAGDEIAREYPAVPLVGVGAVITDGDRVILVRRGAPPGVGDWSIPGGMVHVGETLMQAVIREAHEETGLHVEPQGLVELLERIFPDGDGRIRYHYVLADYWCTVTGGRLAAGSDALDAQWVSRDDLAGYSPAAVTESVILKALDLALVACRK